MEASYKTDLGTVIKTDSCPEKYYEKKKILGSVLVDTIIFLIFEFISGKTFIGSAPYTLTIIAIYILADAIFALIIYFLMSSIGKGLSKTCISVCENGIKGVYQNKDFAIPYMDIVKTRASKDKIIIIAKKEKINLFLHDAKGIEMLIKQHMTA